ncbi:MAG TPA: hypothetical protein VNR38_23795 [Ureibacillus sp.]|uniref:hypothetical protein n=1 Tax=Peribacillus asahii TaxID=228899 RepID=UPI00207944F6|nr:hypothetical protein [Peribacillus asahii]USK61774.1 hypothetical protein LIT37_10905 [Peribacillus asahii]HWL26736.1 hypothetical protein [Ureibacillus sp.]
MITVNNAENHLKNKIGEDTDDIKKVWETFKDFCKEPVEGGEDKEILFQCGVYDFTGEELFHLDFVRQFTVYEENECSRMEQLRCEFSFKPTEELSKLEIGEWSMDYDDIDDFLNHIETLQEFKIPFNLKPIKSEIYQEEV